MQKCWKIIRRSFGVLGIILMIAVLYVCAGIVAAYHVQPEISADYQETFDVSSFYTENRSADRACIIEDNVDALEIRLQMIAQAKERIILSTFEFRTDESGSDILAALVAAAGRGVEVQVLVDGGFSILRMDGNPYFQALSTLDTAEIRIYNRINLLQPWKSMGRMHDKYLIVDDEVYLLGGRNTYDYFLGDNGYKNYDRDVLVYSTDPQDSNASIRQLKDYFSSVWEMEECVPFYDDSSNAGRQKIVQAREELEARYAQLVDTWQLDEMPDYAQMTLPVNRITLLSNPTQVSSKEPTVFYALTRLMQNAKEEVRIHTPYIICNDWMYQCLQEVCSGQASVSLMTNSAANNGNPFGSTDYVKNKDRLLATGLTIYEFEGGVSYHGKSLTIDDDLAIVGSFNMDMRSTYLDTELMLVINSEEVTQQLKTAMLAYEAESVQALPDGSYEVPEGVTRQETSLQRKIKNSLVSLVNVFRFLM